MGSQKKLISVVVHVYECMLCTARDATSREDTRIYGTRRFIIAFTRALHLSLSWPKPIQSTPPNSISLRYNLILSTHLRLVLPSGLFPSGFPTNNLYAFLFSHTRSTCPAHLVHLDLIILITLGEEHESQSSLLRSFSTLPSLLPPSAKIFSLVSRFQTPSVYVPPLMPKTKFHTHTELQEKL
jgi:hypothetical protein